MEEVARGQELLRLTCASMPQKMGVQEWGSTPPQMQTQLSMNWSELSWGRCRRSEVLEERKEGQLRLPLFCTSIVSCAKSR